MSRRSRMAVERTPVAAAPPLLRVQRQQAPPKPDETPKGCGIVVPTGDTALLAGVIFAEALPKRESNDERNAIGSSFVNSVEHTNALCGGTLECKGLNKSRLKAACDRDTAHLGDTIKSAIRSGSLAYKGPLWNLVMSGDEMKPAETLCALEPGNRNAVIKAIESANAVSDESGKVEKVIRFNQAANQPPSNRFEKDSKAGVHTFYRFKAGRECE